MLLKHPQKTSLLVYQKAFHTVSFRVIYLTKN